MQQYNVIIRESDGTKSSIPMMITSAGIVQGEKIPFKTKKWRKVK